MLSIKNLDKTYADGTHALNNVSLELPTGMIGLLGPNGAGKSSLMRTIACIQSPTKGEIHFNGTDVLNDPMSLRKQLGYLPQSFGVYPHMSCKAMLNYLASLKGINKHDADNQIEQLLSLTNLSHVAHKKVANFSGGMKQRFGIAQALLGDPKLIILDEPTAGLDPEERDKFNQLLVTVSQERLILLSTHIVADVENLCNHVAIIHQGCKIAEDNVHNLIAPLQNKVWTVSNEPTLNNAQRLLSRTFKYSKPIYRIYSDEKPASDAQRVEATLQDRYFFEINMAQKGS